MTRPRPSRTRSDWTIDTITVDPQPSSEVLEEEFDNELTLTSEDILRAQKSTGIFLNVHEFSNYSGKERNGKEPACGTG